MFVLLPGRSKEEAFRIGAEIAAAVTAANPPPVALKMEKVYLPCILQVRACYIHLPPCGPASLLLTTLLLAQSVTLACCLAPCWTCALGTCRRA